MLGFHKGVGFNAAAAACCMKEAASCRAGCLQLLTHVTHHVLVAFQCIQFFPCLSIPHLQVHKHGRRHAKQSLTPSTALLSVKNVNQETSAAYMCWLLGSCNKTHLACPIIATCDEPVP